MCYNKSKYYIEVQTLNHHLIPKRIPMAKKQFKAETKRLMELMINSIYTHKEIFLREIVSNASDAIDKMNYHAMTDPSIGLSKDDFRIDITLDEEARTITVSDNGVGMTAKDMEKILA